MEKMCKGRNAMVKSVDTSCLDVLEESGSHPLQLPRQLVQNRLNSLKELYQLGVHVTCCSSGCRAPRSQGYTVSRRFKALVIMLTSASCWQGCTASICAMLPVAFGRVVYYSCAFECLYPRLLESDERALMQFHKYNAVHYRLNRPPPHHSLKPNHAQGSRTCHLPAAHLCFLRQKMAPTGRCACVDQPGMHGHNNKHMSTSASRTLRNCLPACHSPARAPQPCAQAHCRRPHCTHAQPHTYRTHAHKMPPLAVSCIM